MHGQLHAVIFDMDGVLIESESLWRKAMIQGFKEVNIELSEADCRKTMGLRIGEVIEIWIKQFGYLQLSPAVIEKRILTLLLELIEKKGEFIPGIPELLSFCNEKKLKTGIATSSSHLLMHAVIKKLKLEKQFMATISAEHMNYGKPHPEVFLACASELKVLPQHCLVIEDSFNGAVAAKAAQMKVIAVPDEDHVNVKGFAVADYRAKNMEEVLGLFKTIFS
jgi:sugar-phosphatase